MAVRDYTLTLNGSAQRLSTVLANANPGGPNDEAMAQIILAADPGNAAAVYVGSSSAVSSSLFGFAIDPAQATAQDRQSIGPFPQGSVKLSEIWVLGANNEKLHVLAIPY